MHDCNSTWCLGAPHGKQGKKSKKNNVVAELVIRLCQRHPIGEHLLSGLVTPGCHSRQGLLVDVVTITVPSKLCLCFLRFSVSFEEGIG